MIKWIGLAIDDFGTGYSSLMQLRQLPFTEVKIDQAFVSDVDRSGDSRLIVQTIVDLAHGLGLIATAEGVETLEQLRIVHELGCDVVQGYLISPPLEPTMTRFFTMMGAIVIVSPRFRSAIWTRQSCLPLSASTATV